jgi:hypothetical protein
VKKTDTMKMSMIDDVANNIRKTQRSDQSEYCSTSPI